MSSRHLADLVDFKRTDRLASRGSRFYRCPELRASINGWPTPSSLRSHRVNISFRSCWDTVGLDRWASSRR